MFFPRKRIAFFLIFSVIACSDNKNPANGSGDEDLLNVTTGSFTDSRDGKSYKSITVGGYTWMAENLAYGEGEYKSDYGVFYSFDEAKEACPTGWHLPMIYEWKDLVSSVEEFYGDSAGWALKSRKGWTSGYGENGNGSDAIGFNAMPAGSYYVSYYAEGDEVSYWINYGNDQSYSISHSMTLEYDESQVKWYNNSTASSGNEYYYVRCIKDENTLMASLQECKETNDGDVEKFRSEYFICDDSIWRVATKTEALAACSSENEGTLTVYHDTTYICDNDWRVATAEEALDSCTSALRGNVQEYMGKSYVCDAGFWRNFTALETESGVCTQNGANYTYDSVTFSCDGTKNLWLGAIKDSRDNQSYNVTMIGKQIWMTENLNYEENRHCRGDTASNCDLYGGLYSWAAAMGAGAEYDTTLFNSFALTGICPEGWRIPTQTDWNGLFDYVYSLNLNRTTALMAKTGWKSSLGEDLFGFSVLPSKVDSMTYTSKYTYIDQQCKEDVPFLLESVNGVLIQTSSDLYCTRTKGGDLESTMDFAEFWTGTEKDTSEAISVYFEEVYSNSTSDYSTSSSQSSLADKIELKAVRCIKN